MTQLRVSDCMRGKYTQEAIVQFQWIQLSIEWELWNSSKCGIPQAKIDHLRSLLEGASWLTLSSHLVDYTPVIQQQERSTIRKAVEGQDVSVFFNGSSHLGEALAIAVQFLSGWSIQQRIVMLSVLAMSLSSENLGREVLTSFSTELGVTGNCLLASTHDHASVNTAAKHAMSIMYPSWWTFGVFHTC